MTRWLEPKTTAAWNRAAGTLPTRRAGFALWAEADQADDEYSRFIEQQLLTARPRPRIPNEIRVAASLQQAIESVLSGEKTPEAAAAQVMAENP
jgi:ABC-type glycerol-3-phosphate transport system substrate-binding protein